MNQIPTWWLVVSAVFFAINILFFLALSFAMLKLASVIKELQPKIGELSTRVEGLVQKVEQVAERVEEVATHVKETVSDVGAKTSGILGSIEGIAHAASKQFERFSPFAVGAMTAMRLVKSLNEMKHGKSVAEATKRKTLAKKPAPAPAKKKFWLF